MKTSALKKCSNHTGYFALTILVTRISKKIIQTFFLPHSPIRQTIPSGYSSAHSTGRTTCKTPPSTACLSTTWLTQNSRCYLLFTSEIQSMKMCD